jgi:hypothetical protein
MDDDSALKQCGYYKLLEPFQQTLVDRGFKNDVLALYSNSNGIVVPPNLHNGYQFGAESVKRGMELSSKRIMIEQAIRNTRAWKWFNSIPNHGLRHLTASAYQMISYINNFATSFGYLNGHVSQYDSFITAIKELGPSYY